MAITRYHWGFDDCVMHETDENGNTLVTYTHEPGPFGPLISENRGGTTYTHHYDAQGSTVALTNDAGTVTDTYFYDAWGSKQPWSTGTTPTPYTWCGRWGYQDDTATTGGYYARERDYGPVVARWRSVDPLVIINVYVKYIYANNRPQIAIDPDGMDPILYWGEGGHWEIAPPAQVHSGPNKSCCCCCVTSLRIGDAQQRVENDGFGYIFDTFIDLTYHATAGSNSACTLEWWEKTNLPPARSFKKNTWIEMFSHMKGESFDSWTKRKPTGCPDTEMVVINDWTKLSTKRKNIVTRKLEFKVIVRSGKDCMCANNPDHYLEATATETLVLVDSIPDWENSSFVKP